MRDGTGMCPYDRALRARAYSTLLLREVQVCNSQLRIGNSVLRILSAALRRRCWRRTKQ